MHIWAKNIVQLDTGFKCVFLLGCSRTGTLLGLLDGNIDVLRVIGRFLDIEGPTAVNRLRLVNTKILEIKATV